MGTYKLSILPIAQYDMKEIIDHVNTLSPQAALNLYDEIVEGIGSLAEMPIRCPLLRTPELRAKGYRALRVKNYMVFYIVIEDIVQIRRVLYAQSRYEVLL